MPAGADSGSARFTPIVDLLLTVGFIDGVFHEREGAFIEQYVDSMLGSIQQSPAERAELRATWFARVDELYRRLETEVATLSREVTAAGNDSYVSTRLRVRALSLFRELGTHDQTAALELIRALVKADGTIAPAEQSLLEELGVYFRPTLPPTAAPPAVVAAAAAARTTGKPRAAPLLVGAPAFKNLAGLTSPLLDPLEQTYSPHPVERQAQIEWDYQLVQQAITQWQRLRATGTGLLAGVSDIGSISAGARFLDGFVHVMRPTERLELVVLGDLHGCYSCLKAALLQSNFIERVWAYQWDPKNNPDVKLVLLGDYIDRGRFSFDGVLRAALYLFASMPDHVILLRGNHEWFQWQHNQITSGVYPAEALSSIAPHVPVEMLEAYRLLFEHMPTSFVCDRTLFVHAGIPREDTLAEKFRDLSSLNDPDIRFQMMWSDPAPTDHIPVDLQRRNPRFPFGQAQFRAFMERAGMHTLIRGHEKIDRGFEILYNNGEHLLLNLFSAGGFDNADLPLDSSYREVTPMALTVEFGDGPPSATPWPLLYQPFNYEPHNRLYRAQPLLEFRYG